MYGSLHKVFFFVSFSDPILAILKPLSVCVCGRCLYKATLLHFYVKRAHSGTPGKKSI